MASLVLAASTTWSAHRKRKEEALGIATMCALRASPVVKNDKFIHINYSFTNKTTHPIHSVSAHLIGGTTLNMDARVDPHRTWGFKTKPEQVGLTNQDMSEKEARELVNKQVMPRLVFVFSVDGYQFVRNNKTTLLFDEAPEWRSAAPAGR
ncbi:hypothetical protein E7Z53_18010 [Kocuria salina]|uniref:hypothetical protein n=1 Tax=Kocuria salina TaxID=1929416 RepID=UPI00159397CA|nr:hypothetical protein [Kocuria salina]NVC25316.1 hypothetical protein [Kocuria salina]